MAAADWVAVDRRGGVVMKFETLGEGTRMPPVETLEEMREAMERSDAWVEALLKKDKSAGIKLDDGKTRMDLLPFRSLTAVGEVLTFGARKYGEWNWTKVEDAERRFAAAMLRHYAAIQRGEEFDLETGMTHAAHMATSALFVLYFTVLRHEE